MVGEKVQGDGTMEGPVTTGWTQATRPGAWTRPLRDGYRLWVQAPREADRGTPVLWLLDGASLFPVVSATLGWLARRPERSGVSPMLVAGIDHDPPDPARRYVDFSFGPPADPAAAPGEVPWGGGGDFASLLVGDAPAIVAEAFGTGPERSALLGHSLAGQFVLRLLAERPGHFAATGAISPSIWWDRDELLARLAALPDSGQAVFLGVGEQEEPTASATPVDRRRHARRMVSNVGAAAEALSRSLGAGRAHAAIMAGEDHASILPALLPAFLRFACSALRGQGPRPAPTARV